MRRMLGRVGGCVVVLALVVAGVAGAVSSGSVHRVRGFDQPLFEIACPPSGTCVATSQKIRSSGKNSGVVVPVSRDGVPGSVRVAKGSFELGTVGCPSKGYCLAVSNPSHGAPNFVPIRDGKPGRAIRSKLFGTYADACSTSCWATGDNAPGRAAIVHIRGSKQTVYALKGFSGGFSGAPFYCSAANACVIPAQSRNGAAEVVFVSDGKVKAIKHLPSLDGEISLACRSAKSCVVVGYPKSNGASTVIPIVNGKVGAAEHPADGIVLNYAVACTSNSLCFGFGYNNNEGGAEVVVPIHDGHPGAAQNTPEDFDAQNAWCNRSQCLAVGSVSNSKDDYVGAVYSFR